MKTSKYLNYILIIGLLALPVIGEHSTLHPVSVHASAYTNIYNAFLKHGAKKIKTIKVKDSELSIYEVIRNGKKIDWNVNSMAIKVNGKKLQPSNDHSIIKLIDSSNKFNSKPNNKKSKSVTNKRRSRQDDKYKRPKHLNDHENSNRSKKKRSKNIFENIINKYSNNQPVRIAIAIAIIVICLTVLGAWDHLRYSKHHNNKN